MKKTEATIEPRYAIVCDDIRREDNGKQIMIGVYTGDILVNTFPSNINLSFWIHLAVIEAGSAEIEVRVVLEPDDLEVFKMSSKLESDKPDPFTVLAFGGIGMTFKQEGHLSLQMRQLENDWQEINRTLVKAKNK